MNLGIKWLWKDTSKESVKDLKDKVSRNTTNITNNTNNIRTNTTNITNNTNNISRNTNSINTLNTNTAKRNEANTFSEPQTIYEATIGGLKLEGKRINYSETAGPLINFTSYNGQNTITLGNWQSSNSYSGNFTFNLNRNVIEGVENPTYTRGGDIVNKNYVDNNITTLQNRINQLEQQLNSKLTVNGLSNITYFTKIVNMPTTQNTSVVLANDFEVGKVITCQIWFKRNPDGPWMVIPNQDQINIPGNWPGTLEVAGAGGHGQLALWRQANTSTTLWSQCKLVMLYNGTINWRRGV